jgi:hypothetical protein
MAGPFFLDPGKGQTEIPTWAAGKRTKVTVANFSPSLGRLSMKAGASPQEFEDIEPGEVSLERDFGGVLLTLQNEGNVPLTVKTE